MLTDHLYSARHIPPAEKSYIDQLPFDAPYNPNNIGDVTKLFARTGAMKEGRSSALFMFFAQWFTDSILRVDPKDRRKNTSNHNIDLCQIYGLTEKTCRMLRSKSDGKLRSQIINGEEFLDHLGEVENGVWQPKEIYKDLPYVKDGRIEFIMKNWPDRKEKLYATGLERGNSSIGYVAISTMFMREHNRICVELKKQNSLWDDERLFQTARMINIIILLKLVVVDYINHISGVDVFKFDVNFAEKQSWYRAPWISLEFDLLYRWHGLIPDSMIVSGTEYDHTKYRFNNLLLEEAGFSAIINSASEAAAGEISLQNVPDFMLGAEYQTIKMGRDFRLASYNCYRKQFGLKAVESFKDLTDDKGLREKLENLYGDINDVEFIVGIFAEKHSEERLYGELMYAMVAYDAFTQIYTNPLLSEHVFTEDILTGYGLDLIKNTGSVQDLAERNNQSSTIIKAKFSFSS